MTDIPPICFRQEKLKNGLDVILHNDRRVPLVHVTLHYRVGSSYEQPGKSGLAHLFEHMMFQGSENVGKAEHGRFVDSVGGRWNASTSKDRTNYFETLPSNALELALWLEADRMRSLNVTPENFENQRQTVIEEKKQSYDNRPYGTALLRFDALAYENWAYAHPIIGSVDDLRKSTVEDAVTFHSSHYGPDSATLVVAGDILEEETLHLVANHFEDIELRTDAQTPDLDEPRQSEEKLEVVRDELAPLPVLHLGYHIPVAGSRAHYALSMLSLVLAKGESSRLYRRMIYDNNWVASLSAGPNLYRGPQMFIFWFQTQDGVQIQTVQEALEQELSRVRDSRISDQELEKARNQVLYRAVSTRATIHGIGEGLAQYMTYFEDPMLINLEMERYLQVTAEEIQTVAGQFLVPENRTTIIVETGPSPTDSKALS